EHRVLLEEHRGVEPRGQNEMPLQQRAGGAEFIEGLLLIHGVFVAASWRSVDRSAFPGRSPGFKPGCEPGPRAKSAPIALGPGSRPASSAGARPGSGAG